MVFCSSAAAARDAKSESDVYPRSTEAFVAIVSSSLLIAPSDLVPIQCLVLNQSLLYQMSTHKTYQLVPALFRPPLAGLRRLPRTPTE